MYELDFAIFVFNSLPNLLRVEFWISFLQVAVSQVKQLHALFLSFRERSLNDVSYTNQVVSLEGYLKSEIASEIYILDNTRVAVPEFLYREAHGKQEPYIYREADSETQPPILREEHNLYSDEVDFIVKVPSGTNQNLVRVAVDRVNLASMTYKIEVI